MSEPMLHTNLTREDVGGYAFLPGSPQRVARIAQYLEHPQFLRVNREHETYAGTLEGERVIVTSTGMGGPSAVICLEELSRLGVHTFLRVGTCSTTSPTVRRGDLVIPMAAVRMEGTSDHYAPPEYPAVPDLTMLDGLRCAAKKTGYPTHVGVVVTRDGFYTQNEAEDKPAGYLLAPRWEAYKAMGAIASEMECSALFIAGASREVRVGAVMVCATNYGHYGHGENHYPGDDELRAVETAVEAMRLQILADHSGVAFDGYCRKSKDLP